MTKIIIAHHINFYFANYQRAFHPYRYMIGIICYPNRHFFTAFKNLFL